MWIIARHAPTNDLDVRRACHGGGLYKVITLSAGSVDGRI